MGFLSFYTASPRLGSYVCSSQVRSPWYPACSVLMQDTTLSTGLQVPQCPKDPPSPPKGCVSCGAQAPNAQVAGPPSTANWDNFGLVGVAFGSKYMPLSLGDSVWWSGGMRVAVGGDSEEPNAENGSQNPLSLFIHFDHCELSGSSWEFLFYEISLSHLLVCHLTNRQTLRL